MIGINAPAGETMGRIWEKKGVIVADDSVNKSKDGDRHKILVVDDEAGIRRGCERVLRSQGHRVLSAENGEKGLDILRREPDMDLVLVDLRMPGMDGFDFLLQAREIALETVFIMITAYATLESAVEATKRGAYDFIAKPFAPDDFLRLVNRALERVRLIRERNLLDTERRQRMLELATEKSQFHTVIDCMADGVMVCNAEQVLVLHNPAALKALSHDRSIQTPLEITQALECEELRKLISHVSNNKKHLSNEVRISPGPEERWVLANVAPVIDSVSGQFQGTVTVLRDISEAKRLEHMKAQFVNMVAHELRAPLAAVDGYLSVMEKGYVQDREKQSEIINRSKQRIQALLDLVSDLLDVSRMEAWAVQREILPQRIDSVLHEVMDFMETFANQNQISLESQTPERLPLIRADREELVRLFSNLLSNAIKYNNPKGSVRVRAEKDKQFVKVSVADTGIGISKKGLSQLFSEFFREKRAETRGIPGAGLGLSIVKDIVDFYHGRIEVQSELGEGSVFTVYLPFRQPESSADDSV